MRDREWPSYTRVAPLMRQVGQHWQTYTSASNENLYTHLWTGPFYGFRHVIETFEGTERPRRVAPVNVYYHYYSGERVASLAALHHVHEWVLRQPLARLFTSEYLAIVEGFRTARIAPCRGGLADLGPRGARHRALRRHARPRRPRPLDAACSATSTTRARSTCTWPAPTPRSSRSATGRPRPPTWSRAATGSPPGSGRRAGSRCRSRDSGRRSSSSAGSEPTARSAVEIRERAGSRRLRARSGPDGRLHRARRRRGDVEVRVG